MAAVVNYSPPWWVNLFHRLPHLNLQFQLTSSDFRPEDTEYQKVIEFKYYMIWKYYETPSKSMCACGEATSKVVLNHDVTL